MVSFVSGKRRLVNHVVCPQREWLVHAKELFCLLLMSEKILRVGIVLEGVEKERFRQLKSRVLVSEVREEL